MNQRRSAITLLIATLVVGGLGLIAFSLFLFSGPPAWIDLELNPWAALGFDGALSLLFFIQHSGMLRRSVRQALERHLPAAHLDAAYGIASGGLLLVLVVLWQPIPQVIASLSGWGYGAARACFALAVLGFVWTARSLGHFDPLGAHALMAQLGKPNPPQMPLAIDGPYGWVRHPFYFFSIVMIWSFPELTLDRLMFNLIWTIWIWFGAILEERDLVRVHGQAYREYQKTVPMLLPLTLPQQRHPKK